MTAVEHTRYAVAGWGSGELWTSDELVLAHDFHFEVVSNTGARAESGGSQGAPPESAPVRTVRRGAASRRGEICADSSRVRRADARGLTPDELVARFAAFLAGEAVGFDDVELDLGWATPFQRAVAETLREVSRGEVVTYGELAALSGYPRAARAVGTFCATNRFAFVVPCHRVVAAHDLGGYGSTGVEVKRRLLALDGVRL